MKESLNKEVRSLIIKENGKNTTEAKCSSIVEKLGDLVIVVDVTVHYTVTRF